MLLFELINVFVLDLFREWTAGDAGDKNADKITNPPSRQVHKPQLPANTTAHTVFLYGIRADAIFEYLPLLLIEDLVEVVRGFIIVRIPVHRDPFFYNHPSSLAYVS